MNYPSQPLHEVTSYCYIHSPNEAHQGTERHWGDWLVDLARGLKPSHVVRVLTAALRQPNHFYYVSPTDLGVHVSLLAFGHRRLRDVPRVAIVIGGALSLCCNISIDRGCT